MVVLGGGAVSYERGTPVAANGNTSPELPEEIPGRIPINERNLHALEVRFVEVSRRGHLRIHAPCVGVWV